MDPKHEFDTEAEKAGGGCDLKKNFSTGSK